MDELLRHCLQELAFDGDLGCDVSRLRDFVGEFYTSRSSVHQILDDSYHAFVWSLVAQQPSVRVGVLPDGQTSEVFVPPQPRVSKKGKSAQDEAQKEVPTAATLELIPNANNRLLDELLQTYGNKLRIAVDPETCFVAITGSHAKPAKLTPMVYASLQLISRSRESGVSVLELGKATGYDQKTCFYLVKQLLDLDLVVKLRRGGNSQNFCVHKYFFDRSPMWKKIREEELRAKEESTEGGKGVNDIAEARTGSLQLPHFDPIDARHLTSLNILRQRITKLLKHSLNETQPYANISVRIGFRPRSRTDRRFFIVRLKELINEGTIEKFFVTSPNPNTTQNKQLYLRLASSNRVAGSIPAESSAKVTDDDEDMIDNLVTEDATERAQVKSTVTLHRQIVDLVQESSTTGATLNELCDRLGSFDKRTLELLISRMERQAPPPHLADLSVIQVLETHGRERRYRFFTLGGYYELITREGFEQPSSRYLSEDLAKAGGFMEDRETDFYETRDDLHTFLKKWSGARVHRLRVSTEGRGKSSRGARKAAAEGDDGQPKSASKKKWTNPILPDGTRKRGRPLKNPDAAEKRGQKRTKNAALDTDATAIEPGDQTTPVENVATTSGMHEGMKRKRGEGEGRESEAEAADTKHEVNLKDTSKSGLPQDAPKSKRGRPPKKKKKTASVKDLNPSAEGDANAESLRSEATTDASIADSVQPKRLSPRRKKQNSESSHPPMPDPASVSTPVFPPVQPSNLHVSSSILNPIYSAASIPQFPSQTSPFSSNPHDFTQVPNVPAAQSFPSPSEVSPTTQATTDDNRLRGYAPSQAFPLGRPSIPAPTDDHPQFRPATLLESLAAFQGRSREIIGQSEINEEVTRVIASLAAQVNESLSSPSHSSGTEKNVVMQLPIVSPTQSGVNDILDSVRPSSVHSDIEDSTGITTIRRVESPGDVAETEDAAETFKTRESVEDGVLADVQSEAPAQISSAVCVARDPDILEGVNSPTMTSVDKPRKGVSGRKANLTAMRRENEVVQLIENAGGILNTSTTEFLTAYTNFIETIVKAGEVASAPIGARIDRRTLNYSLDKLEANGRIKTIITNIPSVTGGYRNTKLVYLPTVSEERLREYIAVQGPAEVVVSRRLEQVRERAEKEIELDPNSPLGLAEQWLYSNNSLEVYQERWHRNAHRAEQLFNHSDDVVREAMLMEKQTLSQLYGYLTGKVVRARELHLRTIERLGRRGGSPFVVSLEQRVVSWAFFENDISLATHCACITSPVFREDIRNALASDEGRSKLVKDIPDEWKRALQIGKARTRDRIFDMLDYLHSLQLVTPLRESRHDTSPELQDAEERLNLAAFEAMPSDWASKVPLLRPEYWQFSTTAPMYLFALQKDPAPFWKIVPTLSETDAIAYWTELKLSCLNRSHAENAQDSTASTALHGPYTGEQRVATALRRSVSWTADYTLSWYQTQYLKRFVNIHDGSTPLQDQDPEMGRLRRISHVLSAPLDVVQDYFESSHKTMLRELEKKQQREARRSSEKKDSDMKLLLVQKGAEAVQNRESAWHSMVERVHPGLVKGVAAARLRKLRQSYVRGNIVQDNHHWELQISDAIKAAEKMRSSRNLFPSFSQVTREVAVRKQPDIDLSHLPSAAQGKSVGSLIDMQKNSSAENGEVEVSEVGARKSKKKVRARKVKSSGRTRRQRFLWNADYDELARDTYAILRARCRTHHRLEWGAFDQVFPSVPRNSVRARMSMLKDQPGAEAYLQRLENCWHDLWVKNRGTPELPDQNPRNPTEFDLKAHLEYLRKYVDKNAIRVGISTFEEAEYNALPADMENIVSTWNLEERKPVYINWDFLSNFVIGEEAREKLFLEVAFVMESDSIPEEDPHSDSVYFAESALKMVVGTPNESYNANHAASLLHGIGETEINIAMDNLLSRNVLSKLVRDPTRLVPGRTVKISEMNQNALGGPIAKDLFLDASQLEESYAVAKDEWREWPLTSTDGDTAALLQQFSDHKVEFDVNTSHARAARSTIDGNSRKVDDDDIELGVQVKFRGITTPENQATPLDDEADPIEPDDVSDHGTSIMGEQACCKMRSDGVVDCLRCIEEARAQMADWSDDDKCIADSIVQFVDSRAKHGVRIEELKAFMGATDDMFTGIIHRLHTFRVPPIYLTGYVSTIVVSAKYVGAWTVSLPGGNGSLSRVFPRRWLDIAAGRVTMVWEAALRAVVGLVHLRPGISQAELRWRLRSVYDRQEVIDVLNHLMSNGNLKNLPNGASQTEMVICIEALSQEEEKMVFWEVREEKRWYHVS